MTRSRLAIQLVRVTASWAVLGLGLGLAAAVSVPRLFGHPALTVMSGSMAPVIRAGDVVVEEAISPLDARIGDIVTFRDPEDPSRLVTHRVRSIRAVGHRVEFSTKGDVNNNPEQWQTDSEGTIGRVLYRVPKAGYLLFWLRSRVGRLAMIAAPALLLAVLALRHIWAPKPRRGRHAIRA